MFNKITKNVSLKKTFTKVAKGAKKAARSTFCCLTPKEQLEAASVWAVESATIADVSAIEQAVIACELIAEGDHTPILSTALACGETACVTSDAIIEQVTEACESVVEASTAPCLFANSSCEEAAVMEIVSRVLEIASTASVLEPVVEANSVVGTLDSFMEPEACPEFSLLDSVLSSAAALGGEDSDVTIELDDEPVPTSSSVYAEDEVETVAEIEAIEVLSSTRETVSMTSAASAAKVATANADVGEGEEQVVESQLTTITVLDRRLSDDSGIHLDSIESATVKSDIELDVKVSVSQTASEACEQATRLTEEVAEPEPDMEALLAKLEAENQRIEVIGSVLNKASAMNAQLETTTKISKRNSVFGW
ncbi:hypothetical protein G7K_1126-t1 [Saitoella complicata NRRL Y-17804]|uniref:Uncharacterized protein n=2 Tax=Saitoella complicata (strain BCRC 22490 / CBS 7301 / JCM 7358 / NBRC 10748 / NRRL Y-17804) TaxID=698492 RepID=A0A0E9NAT6_SAICN|nr:hypothetical protein G7K_1126-t1 [Saitoella complicata NRRL Y-17804]